MASAYLLSCMSVWIVERSSPLLICVGLMVRPSPFASALTTLSNWSPNRGIPSTGTAWYTAWRRLFCPPWVIKRHAFLWPGKERIIQKNVIIKWMQQCCQSSTRSTETISGITNESNKIKLTTTLIINHLSHSSSINARQMVSLTAVYCFSLFSDSIAHNKQSSDKLFGSLAHNLTCISVWERCSPWRVDKPTQHIIQREPVQEPEIGGFVQVRWPLLGVIPASKIPFRKFMFSLFI